MCQLPAAALHRLRPGSNNPLVTVLLWLEFTCIWNSLARQILWTDPGTIFQCCYNTLLTTFLPGLHGCCLGRRGWAPLNGSSKCLNYVRTLYKYQFFTARYLIFDRRVSHDPRAGSVFSIHSGIHGDLMHLCPEQFSWVMNLILGKAVETIMTRSCLKPSSHVP